MFKMGSHNPFGHSKHKLWPKERPGIKLTIWLPTTKSRESTQFPYVQVACDIPLKSPWQGLKLCFIFHFNQRSAHKIIWPQSCGSPRTKCHLDVGLVERHKVYYKGEGGGFPQVRAVMNLVNLSLPMAHRSAKSAPTMH